MSRDLGKTPPPNGPDLAHQRPCMTLEMMVPKDRKLTHQAALLPVSGIRGIGAKRRPGRAKTCRPSRNGSGSDSTSERQVVPVTVMEQDIHLQMYQAIIEHQLPPGTKLGEEALCDVFGVSRPQIRKVLQRLSHEQLVDLHPNRGAYVAQPSVKESHDVFAVRRLMEPALIETVVKVTPRSQLRELQAFVRSEREAHARHDRQAMIRLSGEFHLRIAELSGNNVLARLLQQLVSRTSLIIAMYEIPGASGCNCDHHERLAALAVAGEAHGAAVFMAEHLLAIEATLRLEDEPAKAVNLHRIFARVRSDRRTSKRVV